MEKDQKKRLIIISVYALILLLFIYGLYSWLKPKPSCFDGIKNQNEEAVDCGGVCAKQCEKLPQQNISVETTGFVPSGIPGKMDIYGKISNPNQTFGSGKFNYEFKIKNSAGDAIITKSGTSYILPGEKKYIVESNLDTGDQVSAVEMIISNAEWTEASEYYEKEKPRLTIGYKNYNEVVSGLGFSEAIGLLKNESPFDFSVIKILVMLKNADGKIIAVNSTEMNTVKSGENREFKVFWPNKFPGDVSSMEIQPDVNVFNLESFMQRYFRPENFRAYQ